MKFSLLITLIGLGHAHMLMKKPPSDKYSGRNDIPESQKDYSLKTPMSPDRVSNICGSVEKIVSSGEYAAGSAVNVELEGDAVHNGGHCQFGFSYDRSTFAVTHKVLGNCVSGSKSYSVPIPSSAPSGPVTFFWSWLNRSGNREMYTNCGQITITGGTGSSIPGKALLVTNIVPSDVKFPEGFADDFGKDLFEAQPDVTAQPSGSYNPGQNTQYPAQGTAKVKDQPNNQTSTTPQQPTPQPSSPQDSQPQPTQQPSPQNSQPTPQPSSPQDSQPQPTQQPSPQSNQQPNSQQTNPQDSQPQPTQQPSPQNSQPTPQPSSPQDSQPQPTQQPSPQNSQPTPQPSSPQDSQSQPTQQFSPQNNQQTNPQGNAQSNYQQQTKSRYQRHYQYQRQPNMQYQFPSGGQAFPQFGGRPSYPRGYGRW